MKRHGRLQDAVKSTTTKACIVLLRVTCLVKMNLFQEERPSPIDCSETETDMFLEDLELIKEVGVILPELIDHYYNGVLVFTTLQPIPNELLVTLNRVMEAGHEAINSVKIIVKDICPLGSSIQLRNMVELLLGKVIGQKGEEGDGNKGSKGMGGNDDSRDGDPNNTANEANGRAVSRAADKAGARAGLAEVLVELDLELG